MGQEATTQIQENFCESLENRRQKNLSRLLSV